MNSLSTQFGGKTLVIETGKIARQSDGAVIVRFGGTVILCTVCASKNEPQSLDFFPLSVHYQEKAFAFGKIPGGYVKREGKPSDRETFISRLIDRSIRPLFSNNFKNEVQVICTLLSYEKDHDPEIASIIGASAALMISGIPFNGPIAAVRVGIKDDEFLINQTTDDLDLVVSGSKDGILMVEASSNEIPEDLMLKAIEYAHHSMEPIIDMLLKLKAEFSKETIFHDAYIPDSFKSLERKVKLFAKADLEASFAITTKQERVLALSSLKKSVIEKFKEEPLAEHAFVLLKKSVLRKKVLKKSRIDGRKPTVIRDITSEVDLLPMTHGSALFTRGETQVLSVATLGTEDDAQTVDMFDTEIKEKFMLHYNFPPFAVGESGKVGAPGRREIGHGRLAWKAIKPLLPEKCPYTIRIVAEVTESNGSSSMATVCATSLAMMDSGIALKRPVAGIAMGLVKEGEKFVVLSDISGDEDYLGDMDFKVAGTAEGITALQMDLKIDSIGFDVLSTALKQAKEGRLHILEKMSKTLSHPRKSVKPHAPRIINVKIAKDKIRDLIGPGGKVIRELCEKTKTKIEIEESGIVSIFGSNPKLLDKAVAFVSELGIEIEIGSTFEGTVVKTMEFGAFVRLIGKKEGLIHISDLEDGFVEKTTDFLKEGDKVKVKVTNVDSRGKISLTTKGV